MKKIMVSLAGMMLMLAGCSSPNTDKEKTESTEDTAQVMQLEGYDKLTVAVSGTLYPSAYHNDNEELVGYNVSIVEAVAEKLGLDVEYMEIGVDGMLTAVKSGQVDVVAEGISPSEEQADGYLMSEPIKHSFTSVVVRKSDDSNIMSLADFDGKKAAGAATTNYMREAEALGAEAVVYDNATADQYILDIENGRTDFIPNDYYIQTIVMANFEDTDAKVGNVFYNPNSSHFVFDAKSKALQEAFNEAIKEMREDGTLTQLSKEFYNGEDVSTEKEEINGIKLSELPTFKPDASPEEIKAAIEQSKKLAKQ